MAKNNEGDALNFDLPGQDSDPTAKQIKVLFAGDQYDGQPLIAITDERIAIFADRVKGIAISEQFGVLLSGPIMMAAMPDQITIGGGYWCLDPRHLSTVPSTTPTPIPLLAKTTPALLSAKDDISSEVSFLEGFSNIGV